jgi:hypothetical protein
VVNAGQAAQSSLLTEESATGDAYQGRRESVDRSHPDMTNDPLWSRTDDVLDNFDELAESFADCSIQTEFTEGERYTHVPDYRTCERVVDYSGACEIRHDYTIEEIFALGAGGTFDPCGDGCVLWTVGRSFPTGPCYQELTGTMRVLKPEAILSARLGHDVSAYFKTEGEKRVLLALIQGGEGELHCPYNEGGVETDCTKLEEDPDCGFISSECVKYAQGESGLCYVFEETWDCGTLQGIPVLEGTSTMDCAGPVRCMGEDCLDAAEEQSSDFAEAAAALEAAQMAVSDMDCSTGSCVVFSGEAMECKKAVGGIVNCCTTPDGISLADYLSLVLAGQARSTTP